MNLLNNRMKILILSKIAFDEAMVKHNITIDNVETKIDKFFISINDTSGTNAIPYFNSNKENVKVMFFDDVEKDTKIHLIIPNEDVIVKAFTTEQAKELFNFIESNKDKDYCIIHCTAGVSRSGAVGTFIDRLFNKDSYEFENTNKYILPNKHILKLLYEQSIRK